MSKTHHDLCGSCAKISTEHSPEGFPLPGEVAEGITKDNPSWQKTHRLIAEAIAERDRRWRAYIADALKLTGLVR